MELQSSCPIAITTESNFLNTQIDLEKNTNTQDNLEFKPFQVSATNFLLAWNYTQQVFEHAAKWEDGSLLE